MAKQNQGDSAATKGSDWFEGQETSANDLPRYAIGDTDPDKHVVPGIEGVYEDSVAEVIEGKTRLLHQVFLREPFNGSKRVLLWGNYQLDGPLPCLEPGTKIRITYVGKSKIRGGKTLKQIKLEFPANAKRRAHPFSQKSETPF